MSGEDILGRREVLGWRFGLERMRRLCSLLGMPQHRFASVHVVGTNGKTSVARMTAALLHAHGVSTGVYTSPHIHSWRERILIGGEPISAPAFDEALERAEQAAEVADRAAGDDGPVTQYELLTAAAFLAFAAARVEVAVVEAGLGGRLDATNVIPSKLTVLTSVGLDHTEWLGETVEEIAAEKLAVLRDHTKLICGHVPEVVAPVVERLVADRHADVSYVSAGGNLGFQGWNLGLAQAAASEFLEAPEWDPREVLALPRSIPGRAQVVPGDPPLIYDAAHNPDGARALADSLAELTLPLRPELGGECPVVACLAILEDKDAAGIVAALAPACARFVCTEIPAAVIEGSGRPDSRAHPAADLVALCKQAGVEAEAVADPLAAWARARELAIERGGVALAAGSHYLLRCLWTEEHAESS